MDSVTLTEFLMARIDEDGAVAREAGGSAWHVECYGRAEWMDDDERAAHLAGASHSDECVIDGPDFRIYDEGGHSPKQAQHIARHDPASVLAECGAKRRIVEMAQSLIAQTDLSPLSAGFGRRLLLNLACVYADHPDFRDEWKP